MNKAKKSSEITICFLSHSAGNWGAEKAFPKLLGGLKNSGIKIHVLLPSYGPVVKDLEERNIAFDIVPYRRWLNEDKNLLKRIKRTTKNLLMVIPTIIKIRRWKCDLVYTNTSTICIGAFAAKLLGLPHLWHFREFGFEDYKYTYDIGKKLTQWLTNRLSTTCLVNSFAVAQKYKQFIPEKKLKVIYEAYVNTDTDSIANNSYKKLIQKAEINCVIVGTLHETKGHIDAINAVNELHIAGIKAKLFIVGEGEENYKKDLNTQIEKLKLQNYIEFMGYLNNPQAIMEQCDMLLMCSKNEAFGLVTLEAMQLGKPVIGSKSGGTMELIKEEFNGLFYKPGDFKELAQKIKTLYENPELAKQMGNNGREWVKENFNPGRYISETISVIENLVIH